MDSFYWKVWMVKNKGQSGQSTVEYIFLLAVVVTMALKVIDSAAFKNLLGENSEVFEKYRRMMEFSYKHAYLNLEVPVNEPLENYNGFNGPNHPSYINPGGNDTRIFIVTAEYGKL